MRKSPKFSPVRKSIRRKSSRPFRKTSPPSWKANPEEIQEAMKERTTDPIQRRIAAMLPRVFFYTDRPGQPPAISLKMAVTRLFLDLDISRPQTYQELYKYFKTPEGALHFKMTLHTYIDSIGRHQKRWMVEKIPI